MSIRRIYSKYRAVKTEVDGMTFASKKEAARYCELKMLEKAKQIRNLKIPKAKRRAISERTS